jgi:probable HAF family extracellular repeat protein
MNLSKVAQTLMAFVAACGMSHLLTAQQIPSGAGPQHHRYKLIDLGTLGGPNSQVNGTPPPMINNRGIVAGIADTSKPCPYFDGFVSSAVSWDDGVITNLGLLPGGCFSLPNAINSEGMMAGSADIGVIDPVAGVPEIRADFLYKGQILNLGTFGGTNSLANDLNNRAQVVGGAENTDPDPWNFGGLAELASPTAWHAFLWQDGLMRDLGTLGGPDSFAFLINESGLIAGFSFTNSIPNPTTGIPTVDPFLWNRGAMTDLGTLGGTFGYVAGLNNRGQVAGFSNLAGDLANHAFLWDRGVLTDIGTLGGDNSNAFWINDAGQVVGNAQLADGTHHAFVWRDGKMTDLGTVGDDPCSNGFFINNRGQVLGTTADCHGTILHLVLWENGSVVDLGAQVLPGSDFAFLEPIVINDDGDIVANGTLLNGNVHAVLLKPEGFCDRNCEANAGTSQTRMAKAYQNGRNSNTARQESTANTRLERIRNQMRLPYQLPGRP